MTVMYFVMSVLEKLRKISLDLFMVAFVPSMFVSAVLGLACVVLTLVAVVTGISLNQFLPNFLR